MYRAASTLRSMSGLRPAMARPASRAAALVWCFGLLGEPSSASLGYDGSRLFTPTERFLMAKKDSLPKLWPYQLFQVLWPLLLQKASNGTSPRLAVFRPAINLLLFNLRQSF